MIKKIKLRILINKKTILNTQIKLFFLIMIIFQQKSFKMKFKTEINFLQEYFKTLDLTFY